MTMQLVQQYSLMVQFLCHMLGPNYEVALYDCSAGTPQVAAIANGHITGRTLGAGLTYALEKMLQEERWKTQDWQQHYGETSADGTLLRSSVLFLKNRQNALEGLFCISFDDRRYKDLTAQLFALCHPTEFSVLDISIGDAFSGMPAPTRQESRQSVVSSSLTSTIDEAVAMVLGTTDRAFERLKKEERIRIIRLLHQNGFFSRKGAVAAAAEKLNCSKPSIYRYLNNMEGIL